MFGEGWTWAGGGEGWPDRFHQRSLWSSCTASGQHRGPNTQADVLGGCGEGPGLRGVASDRAADSTLPAPPYRTLVLGVSVGRDQRSGHLVIVSTKLQPRVCLRFFFLITFCNKRITNGNHFLKIHESLLAELLALFPSHLQTMTLWTMSCSSL